MKPTSCTVCGKDVVMVTIAGRTERVTPSVYNLGLVVVLEREDGTVVGELRPLGAALADGEERHSFHKCAGRDGQLDEVRKAQSTEAAKQRNQRGKWHPRHAGPRVGGMRITPRGDHR